MCAQFSASHPVTGTFAFVHALWELCLIVDVHIFSLPFLPLRGKIAKGSTFLLHLSQLLILYTPATYQLSP